MPGAPENLTVRTHRPHRLARVELAHVQEIARPVVDRRARRLSPEDRDDLLQDVLIKYDRAWPHGEPDNVGAWLERAIANALIDRSRAADRRNEEPREVEEDLTAAFFTKTRLQESTSFQVIEQKVIDAVFALISHEDADLLRERYLWNRPAAEVAEQLGIGVDAVNQRTTRAKHRLRDAIIQRPDLIEELRKPHPHVY